MDEIEINIFEYELAGYKREGEADTAKKSLGFKNKNEYEPQVYTASLQKGTGACPIIKVKDTEAGGETRSCDVLEGILTTDLPLNPSEIIKPLLADEITIKPTPELPEFKLSNLLLITTVFPTKLETRPARDEFLTKINSSNFNKFYEKEFIPLLTQQMTYALNPVWTTMVKQTEEELKKLQLNVPKSVPTNLHTILEQKIKNKYIGSESIKPTLSAKFDNTTDDEIKVINSKRIKDYTMVEVHKPAKNDQYIMVGDLHGSLGTFVRLLYRWKLLGYLDNKGLLQKQDGNKLNILFLGDLCDRGVWGYEIYYTLFYLYLVNKGNKNGEFYITRGNHEERSQNKSDGFLKDINTIFPFTEFPILKGNSTKYSDGISTNFNYFHDYINTILGYLPSGHQIVVNNEKFLYLAHGGYPLKIKPDTCNNPTVVSLSTQENIYFYDPDISANKNTIRWNDYNIIQKTTDRPGRACAIGKDAIDQAKEKHYVFTIRAHQDMIANTQILVNLSKEDETFLPVTGESDVDKKLRENKKTKYLENNFPFDFREIQSTLKTICPDGSTKSNCKGSIATMTVDLNSQIKINAVPFSKILPVLTLSTNTDFKRDLFRDSYVMVKFKKIPPPPPPPPPPPKIPLSPRESCLTKPPPRPSGLFRELQNLFTDVHTLDKSTNDLIQKLEILNVLDKCTDIKTFEGTICDAQIALDNALKEYKNNVEDVQGPGSAPPIAAMPVIEDKQYKNSQINGKTIKGSLQDMQKRSKCDKKYLASDISALVAYGFLKRSSTGVITLPNDITHDDIYEFIEWTTSSVRNGYPYLIAKWLLQMRSNLLKDIENNSNPDQTQRVLREEVAKIESSLSIGNVTNEFLDPRKLSNASGFIAPPPPPPPPPPKSKLKPDQTNIYYKQLFEALNTLIEAYITFINKLKECMDAPPTKDVWSCDPGTNTCVSYKIPKSLDLVAGQFETQAECEEKCKKPLDQTVWSCNPVTGVCFDYKIPASATLIANFQFATKEECAKTCIKGGGGGPPTNTREVWVCDPTSGTCSKQTINLPATEPLPAGLYEKENECKTECGKLQKSATAIKTAEDARNAATAAAAAAAAENARLTAALAAAHQALTTAQGNVAAAQTRVDAAQARADAAQARADAAARSGASGSTTNSAELARATAEIAQLRAAAAAALAAQRQAEADAASALLAQRQAELATANAIRQLRECERAAANQDVDNLDRDIANLNQDIDELQNELNNTTDSTEIDNINSRLTVARAAKVALEARLSAARATAAAAAVAVAAAARQQTAAAAAVAVAAAAAAAAAATAAAAQQQAAVAQQQAAAAQQQAAAAVNPTDHEAAAISMAVIAAINDPPQPPASSSLDDLRAMIAIGVAAAEASASSSSRHNPDKVLAIIAALAYRIRNGFSSAAVDDDDAAAVSMAVIAAANESSQPQPPSQPSLPSLAATQSLSSSSAAPQSLSFSSAAPPAPTQPPAPTSSSTPTLQSSSAAITLEVMGGAAEAAAAAERAAAAAAERVAAEAAERVAAERVAAERAAAEAAEAAERVAAEAAAERERVAAEAAAERERAAAEAAERERAAAAAEAAERERLAAALVNVEAQDPLQAAISAAAAAATISVDPVAGGAGGSFAPAAAPQPGAAEAGGGSSALAAPSPAPTEAGGGSSALAPAAQQQAAAAAPTPPAAAAEAGGGASAPAPAPPGAAEAGAAGAQQQAAAAAAASAAAAGGAGGGSPAALPSGRGGAASTLSKRNVIANITKITKGFINKYGPGDKKLPTKKAKYNIEHLLAIYDTIMKAIEQPLNPQQKRDYVSKLRQIIIFLEEYARTKEYEGNIPTIPVFLPPDPTGSSYPPGAPPAVNHTRAPKRKTNRRTRKNRR